MVVHEDEKSLCAFDYVAVGEDEAFIVDEEAGAAGHAEVAFGFGGFFFFLGEADNGELAGRPVDVVFGSEEGSGFHGGFDFLRVAGDGRE